MYSKSRSCIKVKTGLTNYIDLNLGVRQGDNLSPTLFKIFINDLPKYLEETIDPVNIEYCSRDHIEYCYLQRYI